MQYHHRRILGHGPDGAVEEVAPDRLGAAAVARRRAPVPAGARRNRLREVAESLARLGHPGIATVVDVVEVDDHLVEVLTTLGEGGSLGERLTSGPLSAEETRDVLFPIADALAAAHGAGVAHGHVAAPNVVFHAGRPMLTDFGLREARTGRSAAHPFRDDVRDLATLGTALLDPDDTSAVTGSLRALLHRIADDPDASLADLRAGLDRAEQVGSPPPPPPPAPAAVEPAAASSSDHRMGALTGVVVLLVGLAVGAGWALLPRGRPVEVAAPATCEPVAGPLRADVDGDGCDEPLDWQADVAEVAYRGADGTLLRFRMGQPGDDLAVGDWDCDGTDTAAVVRPATGETFLFDRWAERGQTLVAEPGPSLPTGADASVVADGACDLIRPAGT